MTAAARPLPRPVWLVVDLVTVSLFAIVGRLSHSESLDLAGWWHTAWPFLTALVAGWAVLALLRRDPTGVLSGTGLWLGTVIGGMLLRRLSDQGTATPFIVVATLVLAACLVLPRLINLLLVRGARQT